MLTWPKLSAQFEPTNGKSQTIGRLTFPAYNEFANYLIISCKLPMSMSRTMDTSTASRSMSSNMTSNFGMQALKVEGFFTPLNISIYMAYTSFLPEKSTPSLQCHPRETHPLHHIWAFLLIIPSHLLLFLFMLTTSFHLFDFRPLLSSLLKFYFQDILAPPSFKYKCTLSLIDNLKSGLTFTRLLVVQDYLLLIQYFLSFYFFSICITPCNAANHPFHDDLGTYNVPSTHDNFHQPPTTAAQLTTSP